MDGAESHHPIRDAYFLAPASGSDGSTTLTLPSLDHLLLLPMPRL